MAKSTDWNDGMDKRQAEWLKHAHPERIRLSRLRPPDRMYRSKADGSVGVIDGYCECGCEFVTLAITQAHNRIRPHCVRKEALHYTDIEECDVPDPAACGFIISEREQAELDKRVKAMPDVKGLIRFLIEELMAPPPAMQPAKRGVN